MIAFDSDGTISELSGGFRLVYQMVDRYFVPNEVREEIVNLKETEEILLSKIFTPGTDKMTFILVDRRYADRAVR